MCLVLPLHSEVNSLQLIVLKVLLETNVKLREKNDITNKKQSGSLNIG